MEEALILSSKFETKQTHLPVQENEHIKNVQTQKSDRCLQYTPGDSASISVENWEMGSFREPKTKEISVSGLATSVDKNKEKKKAHMGSNRPRSFFMFICFVSLLPFSCLTTYWALALVLFNFC